MYVVVQHTIRDPDTAFARGQKLMRGEEAPGGVRVHQFYPSRDGKLVTCLWEAGSIEAVQHYVDETLGEASDNLCYEVDATQAFAGHAANLSARPAGISGASERSTA